MVFSNLHTTAQSYRTIRDKTETFSNGDDDGDPPPPTDGDIGSGSVESGVLSGITFPSASVVIYLRGLPLLRLTGSPWLPMEPPLVAMVIPVPAGIVMVGKGPEGPPPSIEGALVPRIIPVTEAAGRVAAGACRPCGDPAAPIVPPVGVPNPTLLGCKRL
jgi:hypothetical protein